MPFYLQLSEGRKERRRQGKKEGRKEGKKVQIACTSSPISLQVSIDSYILPSSCPCHSTETTLPGVRDDLASDGQFQSFALWISTQVLRVSHFPLLTVHALVSVTLLFWFSSCKPLFISLLLKYVCSFICLEPPAFLRLHCLLDHLPFSFGFSSVFYENCPCLSWDWISFTWNCFLAFSHPEEPIHQHVMVIPPSKHLRSIPSHYFWCRLPHLSLYRPSPGLRSHLLTGLPSSTLASLLSILPQNQSQMLTWLFHIFKLSLISSFLLQNWWYGKPMVLGFSLPSNFISYHTPAAVNTSEPALSSSCSSPSFQPSYHFTSMPSLTISRSG